MRSVIRTTLAIAALLSASAGLFQVSANIRFLDGSAAALRSWSWSQPQYPGDKRREIIQQTKERVRLYHDLSEMTHRLDGLLVNRSASGYNLDICDSLLFSSLQYVALKKLGMDNEAASIWKSIESARRGESWVRHPKCSTPTSRDMIVGLMLALAQRPENHEIHIRTFNEHIAKTNGYFGTGPVYVSYITPSVGRLIYLVSRLSGLQDHEIAEIVRNGYSTHELATYWIGPGYEAHLVALSLWLEVDAAAELWNLKPKRTTLEFGVDWVLAALGSPSLSDRRVAWTTHKLAALDPANLFFRYLRLMSANAISEPVALGLLEDLLAMPQFPKDRLPANCDRSADYLWQRSSAEYRPRHQRCTRTFSGVDFTWIAAMLLPHVEHPPAALGH